MPGRAGAGRFFDDGRHEEAGVNAQRLPELQPGFRSQHPLGAAYFYKRQFDDAAAILLAAPQEAPGFAVTYRFLAAYHAHMGRADEAREIVRHLCRHLCRGPERHPYRNQEYQKLFLSDLRLAAGETGWQPTPPRATRYPRAAARAIFSAPARR